VGSKNMATAKSAGKIAVKAEKSVHYFLTATAKSVKHAIHKRTEDTSHDEAGSEDATDLAAEKTDAPGKETDAQEKVTTPRVAATSVLPCEDDMHDEDGMHDEDVVDEKNAAHDEDEFNNFFGQGAFDQKAFAFPNYRSRSKWGA